MPARQQLERFPDKLEGMAHSSKASLRLWLKLLSVSTIIEKRVRTRLESEFRTTLPRFDVLAALERASGGLSMGQLSTMLMVSNGNVTGVVARLVREGLVARVIDSRDRRAARVRLTPKGRRSFLVMASVHERWIDDMMAGVSDKQMSQLIELLGVLRRSVETEGKRDE